MADMTGANESSERAADRGWDQVVEQSFPASDPPPGAIRMGPPVRAPLAETAPAAVSEHAPGWMRGPWEATAGPCLSFGLATQIEQLKREQPWQAGRNAKTIVKFPDFRMVVTVMRAQTRMAQHHADGRISVQAITGHIRLHLAGQAVDLLAGELLVLDRAIPHDVEALEESAFLLTIAWPGLGHIEGAAA